MYPLRIRSHYSLLSGTMSVGQICERAKGFGHTTVALADRDNLYGLWPFLAACREHGLIPVIGAEVSEPDGSLSAACYVKNEEGYSNLCNLLTKRHTQEGFSLARALAEHGEGLAVLAQDAELLQGLKNCGMDAWADLGPRPAQKSRVLKRWAESRAIPVTASYDCSVADEGDIELHLLLRAIDDSLTLSQARRKYSAENIHAFVSPEEMANRFGVWPGVVEQSKAFAALCSFRHPNFGLVMPPWEGSGEAAAMLRRKAYAGARRRYGEDLGEVVVDRLEHELRVIENMGFSSYFLVVRDIVHRKNSEGKRQKRRICGRGSGAASLVAYCLEITNVCPIKYNLYFERFLNPGRKDPPDIDVDFAWDERDDVLAEVLTKHTDHAAMVCNHIFFKPRMAIRETAKAFGMPGYEISRITTRIPWLHTGSSSLLEQLRNSPTLHGEPLHEPWPTIIGMAERLVGLPRHLSVHPGGVVITPGKIRDYVPIERAPKGVPIIQWEKDGAEEAGLVKIDLLGNRSLGVIRDCIASVRARGVHFDELRWEPEDDVLTQENVARGATMGCFYIESPAMRLLQQKAATGSYEQLVLQSSIIRPAANEFVREYVRRLRGGPWQPLHDRLGDVLDETFGLMVYQEDVSRVAVHLAGFSHARADGLRKIMSKKDKQHRLADYRQEFFQGCRTHGVGDSDSEKIWQMMMSFDGYSFCKPHSASYARVSFQAAYLKTYFPAEFMAAVISNRGGYYSTFGYVSEAKRLGVRVLRPDVNLSGRLFTGKDGAVRVGLQFVRAVSDGLIGRILAQRESGGTFVSAEDFFRRCRPQEDEARQLIHAGALDALLPGANRTQLLWQLASWQRVEQSMKSMSLFDAKLPPPPHLPPPSSHEKLRREYFSLGFLCGPHPIVLFHKRGIRGTPSYTLNGLIGRKVRFLGWLLSTKLVSTRTGEAMEFLTFEDEHGVVETTFFPKVYRRYANLLCTGRPYMLYGLVEEDFGAVTLTVERLESLEKVE